MCSNRSLVAFGINPGCLAGCRRTVPHSRAPGLLGNERAVRESRQLTSGAEAPSSRIQSAPSATGDVLRDPTWVRSRSRSLRLRLVDRRPSCDLQRGRRAVPASNRPARSLRTLASRAWRDTTLLRVHSAALAGCWIRVLPHYAALQLPWHSTFQSPRGRVWHRTRVLQRPSAACATQLTAHSVRRAQGVAGAPLAGNGRSTASGD